MGLFSPGKMRFFSPRKKKAVLEEEEPVSASPLGDASTHAAYAAYESSFPRRDRRDIAPVVLHVAVASPAPPSPARAEASRDVGASTADERRDRDAESDALPLERCIKVDASMAGDTSPGAQAYQLDWILAEASRAYRTSFENSSFRSGDLLAGGQ